ncbi:DNA polymerase III subunit chi [Sodalis endosymbiont of Henestaris halophilus]|uniref:DNA polymerase III subunit chi n=1 Tax=Sodalis endosymbiont of Henestaris halophilus TaxID=1929246 RepID=UPI000BC05801|nr:DNA polymerase III subunit chi [Sodalis endosymbiont of Henestaris halophilus]SNC59075.1 DNA polymerase III subunit chi [Sodalis endosymbiont of Henestaris halophilus]
MKTAIFYLLDEYSIKDGLTSVERTACDLAADKWREGKRVVIACDDDSQAFRMDEALWTRDPDAFVPHNLVGEGSRYGSPVEICWPQRRSNSPKGLLINLQQTSVAFVSAFNEVIDFVPNQTVLKQLARDRYRVYRSIGFQLTTAPSPM